MKNNKMPEDSQDVLAFEIGSGEDIPLPQDDLTSEFTDTEDLNATYLDGVYKEPNSPDIKLEVYLVTKSIPLTSLPVDGEYNGYHMNTILAGPSILVRYVSSPSTFTENNVTYNYANITVTHMYERSWINLILPLDWEYEIREATEDNGNYSPAIRPRGEEGWVTIEYRRDGFVPEQEGLYNPS